MCSTIVNIDGMMATASVKNTFINWHVQPSSASRRNKSLPPSFGSELELGELLEANRARDDCNDRNMTEASTGTFKSDDSTLSDIRTEVSSDDTPSVEALCGVCAPIGYTVEPVAPTAAWDSQGAGSLSATTSAKQSTPLSSKANAFKPNQQLSTVNVAGHGQVVELIDKVKARLEACKSVASVDLTQGLNGWTLSVVPGPSSQGRRCHEQLKEYAKSVLRDAAEDSKGTFVLGYGYDEVAFQRQPHGFMAQLGVVEHSESVCWALVKYGTCRYGEGCCREHPVLQVPIRVAVESGIFVGSRHRIQNYKQEMANFMMIVTAILTRSSSVEEAAALTDQNGDAWRIDMSIRAEDMSHKESFLTLAKNAFIEAMQRSSCVRIMGTGASPFISKSNGFVVMLGEMADKSQACWDVYQQGSCWREMDCQWQHPQCIMPVNVVIKTMVNPTEPAATKETASPCLTFLSSSEEPQLDKEVTPMDEEMPSMDQVDLVLEHLGYGQHD